MTELKKLGKYEIEKELGRGAMGVVYKGIDPFIKRPVALKTINKELLQSAEAKVLLERFQQEAQAVGRLNHQNIVDIYEFGEDEGAFFIAMEFVEGRELEAYFQETARFGNDNMVNIMLQLLDALGYSHQNGVIHRDIKPANILVKEDGALVVTDFGIARLESSNLTQAGTVMGTPSYMSPEQFTGQTVDQRSDIFSVGVILYQLLTGEKPFVGSIATIMHKVLKESPINPSALNVQVPVGFDAIVSKAVAKRPEDRFQSAAEFSEAIRETYFEKSPTLILNDQNKTQVLSQDATVFNDAAAATIIDKHIAQTVLVPPAAVNKKSPLLLVIVMLTVLVVSGGGYVWWGNQQKERESVMVTPVVPPIISDSAKGVTHSVVQKNQSQKMEQQESVLPTSVKTVIQPAAVEKIRIPEIVQPVLNIAVGYIQFKTEPEGAEIYINNQLKAGRTPVKISLQPGEYQITLKKAGFKDLSTLMEVVSASIIPFSVMLSKE